MFPGISVVLLHVFDFGHPGTRLCLHKKSASGRLLRLLFCLVCKHIFGRTTKIRNYFLCPIEQILFEVQSGIEIYVYVHRFQNISAKFPTTDRLTVGWSVLPASRSLRLLCNIVASHCLDFA